MIPLHQICSQFIDYAGFFPPAQKNLAECLAIYNEQRQKEPFNHWQGRLVLPFSQIQHLKQKGISLTIISQVQKNLEKKEADWMNEVQNELNHLHQYIQNMGPFKLDFHYDIKISQLSLTGFMKALSLFKNLPHLKVFFEFEPSLLQQNQLFESLLKEMNPQQFGVKIRTGSLNPQEVPSTHYLAGKIFYLAKKPHLFKATQGLHHPFYAFHKDYGAYMHGFMNVLTAYLASSYYTITETQIEALLKDTEAGHFKINESGLNYKGEFQFEFYQLQQKKFLSFGSCDLTDAYQDFLKLGFL